MAGFGFVLIAGLAYGAESYLESPPLATKELADAAAATGLQAGCPALVVRRYVKGEGWRHVVRLDPGVDAATRERCRSVPLGEGIALSESTGGRVGAVPSATPQVEVAKPLPWTVDEVLSRMVRAHDGAAGGVEGAGTVLFRFERTTPEGGRVEHTYVRRGEDRYLRVDVRAGEGISSRSGVVGGTAWLDGSTAALTAEIARGQIDRFAPRAVLHLATGLAAGTLDLEERPQLRIQAVVDEGPHQRVVVGTEGDGVLQPLRLEIDTRTWRLLQVSRGAVGADVTWQYVGWKENEDGALRPVRLEVRRGSRVLDVVEVTELELSPVLPDEWFVLPGA